MEKKRYECMDTAKGIGMLAVILGHVGIGTPGILLYSFHLPLFFIISGFFFRYTENFGTFLGKKAKGYLIPYFGCGIIITLFDFFLKTRCKISALTYDIKNLLIQKRFTTLWFLAALFIGVILFWGICHICKNNLKYILVISFGISVLFILYDEWAENSLPWDFDAACIVLFFLAFGYYLKNKGIIDGMIHKTNGKMKYIVILGCISLFCTGLNYILFHETFEMFRCRYGIFPLTVTAACTASVGIILLSSMFHSKVLEYIGRNSMAFFAFHQSIGIVIGEGICKQIFSESSNPVWVQIIEKGIVFLSALFVCWIMDIVLRSTRLRVILGVWGERKLKE